jgi:hypothetical protein
MTDKVPGKPKADAATNVVVFGVDDDCKPHAGWFSKPDADRARTAAKQLRASISPLLAANWTSRSFGSGSGRRAFALLTSLAEG